MARPKHIWSGWHLLGWITLAVLTLIAPKADAGSDATHHDVCRQLAPMVGPGDALVVASSDDAVICSINAEKALVPASIFKVLTAMAALHHLGPSHRFATDFYIRSGGAMVIKGFGDPLLVSESIDRISRYMATRVTSIEDLILDDSYFSYPLRIPGRGSSNEPYDAPNGALCVNFNTVFFKKEKGSWVSAEPQTPLLPVTLPKIVRSGLAEGRITLAANRKEGLRYSGEMFRYFFEKAGIAVNGGILFGGVDEQRDRLLWRYLSDKELTQVVADLLEFSNNFIANQLLLSIGAKVHGPPATVEKGVAVLRDYYHNTLGLSGGRIEEASGLSRSNRLTAKDMLHILGAFEPYHQLMRRQGRQWYKTGHLKGVRTRAGYLESSGGQPYRFVVMINTPGKTTDKIMQVLERRLK